MGLFFFSSSWASPAMFTYRTYNRKEQGIIAKNIAIFVLSLKERTSKNSGNKTGGALWMYEQLSLLISRWKDRPPLVFPTKDRSSAKKTTLQFFLHLRDQKYRWKGRISGGLNLLVTWIHVCHAQLDIMLLLSPKTAALSSNLTASMSMLCYCFSIKTGSVQTASACRACWNKGLSLSSFNLSLSMPDRRKKIEEEERWKFWNKPFLLCKSAI